MRRTAHVLVAAATAALAGACEFLPPGVEEIACAALEGDGTALGGECGVNTCTACETCVENPLSAEPPTCREVCIADTDCATGCCGLTPGALAAVCLEAAECDVECGGVPCAPGERCADTVDGSQVCAAQCADDNACLGETCCLESTTGDRTCHDAALCAG